MSNLGEVKVKCFYEVSGQDEEEDATMIRS